MILLVQVQFLFSINLVLKNFISGLGVSLKTQRKYNGGEVIDSGLYIRSVRIIIVKAIFSFLFKIAFAFVLIKKFSY